MLCTVKKLCRKLCVKCQNRVAHERQVRPRALGAATSTRRCPRVPGAALVGSAAAPGAAHECQARPRALAAAHECQDTRPSLYCGLFMYIHARGLDVILL
ncbi:hypothetical protein TIFTF001_036359 [Ficus carica]|uniref:Uncharacterized protein n=1 Tax=Ficus carica TaxID=3494 RepID=A0AA88E7G1_FICCA|nr:hypothetical protein TIFTF001_036359 [Ficus carica]